MLFIIACAQQRAGTGQKEIVGTLMTNLGMEHALEKHGMNLHRAKVGDRYVMEMLQQTGGMVGGDRMTHHNYASHYAEHLNPLIGRDDLFVVERDSTSSKFNPVELR